MTSHQLTNGIIIHATLEKKMDEIIIKLAKGENRSKSNMIRQLLGEAIEAREKNRHDEP